MGLKPEELIEKLRRIAAGGCAMIIVGDVPVLPHGFAPSLYTRKGMEFYKALTSAVQDVYKRQAPMCTGDVSRMTQL